ncbi:MAG: periplasmic heavy metal sensor [Candidatus Obscuribacterales bacterium]|nr:periplasmic heavy metal sensor [Candidatus Obscuribacterales bacterium]
MMILRRLIVLSAATLMLALPAISQPAAQGGPAPGGGGFDRLTGKYALTPDQEKKLQALSTQLLSKLQEAMPTLETKRMAVLTSLTEAKIDSDKLQSLQTELNTATNNMANAVLQNQIQQMQVLTPEQRAQMKPDAPGAKAPK